DLGTATGNCAWGEDGSTLFITSNSILYRIRLNTKSDAHGLLIELKSPAPVGSDSKMPDLGDLLTAITFIRGPEGSEQDLMTELLSTTAPTRAEPGNLRYDLYQSPTQKNYFMRFEVWRNPDALEAHKQTPHLKASFERRKNKGWMTEITTWKRVQD